MTSLLCHRICFVLKKLVWQSRKLLYSKFVIKNTFEFVYFFFFFEITHLLESVQVISKQSFQNRHFSRQIVTSWPFSETNPKFHGFEGRKKLEMGSAPFIYLVLVYWTAWDPRVLELCVAASVIHAVGLAEVADDDVEAAETIFSEVDFVIISSSTIVRSVNV